MAEIKTHKINGVHVLVQRIPDGWGWYAWVNNVRYMDITVGGSTEEEVLNAISEKIVERQNESVVK